MHVSKSTEFSGKTYINIIVRFFFFNLLIALIFICLQESSCLAAGEKKNSGSVIIGSDTLQKITYTTSSVFGNNHEGRKAIDSDHESAWISGKGGPHWIEIDFGIKRIMDRITLYPGKKDNFPTVKQFIIQFMYDREWFNYTEISVPFIESGSFFSKKKYPVEKVEIDLGGIDASKFRIMIPIEYTYDGYAAIAEIETYIGSNKLKYFDERLLKICMPINNGLLPAEDRHYPNAPRSYRGGVHTGIDIYYYHDSETYEPIPVSKDTPVIAAGDGTVIRADWDYRPMTANEWLKQSEYYKKHPDTFVRRSFGGIQVWIDHHNGIVTTYNHLSRIDENIKRGYTVKKGERIGWAGNSGLMGEAEGKDYGIHLHFEIWVDGYYLGKGMNIKDIKKYFTWIFSVR